MRFRQFPSIARVLFGVAAGVGASWVAPAAAPAWSTKEHIQLTRLAIDRLLADAATPPDMKAWLAGARGPGPTDMDGEKTYFFNQRTGAVPRGVDGIPFWAVMPDMNALMDRPNKKLEPFKSHERTMHYFELEFFGPDDLKPAAPGKGKGKGPELIGDAATAAPGTAPSPAADAAEAADPAAADTSTRVTAKKPDPARKVALADVPKNLNDPRLKDAGYLPYRVEDCYQKLVADLKRNRLTDAPGQYPRDEHAARWAGFLAHYLEDTTQPQHGTADYQSRAYFPAGVKVPNSHAVVEYRSLDDENNDYPELRGEYWPLFVAQLSDARDPVAETDPWKATVDGLRHSYDALPLIGEASVAAWRKDLPAEESDPKGVVGNFDVPAFYRHAGVLDGKRATVMEMKARQTAIAVARVARFWRQAWDEARK